MKSSDQGFEEALQALETCVRELEGGDLAIDQALSKYEEGVELARTCHEHLEAAEKRIAALTRGPDHQPREQPLD